MSEPSPIYKTAIGIIEKTPLLRRTEKTIPEQYIVATHGPALTKAIIENPELLNLIGIYRVNCSHIGKEPDLEALAQYLRKISQFVPILIDLQGPKPRIHELDPILNNKPTLKLGEKMEVRYMPANSPERFCTP